MRIARITVNGLFGNFTHELAFRPDDQIAIMIGPNGVGKTMILRIINTLFNHSVSALNRVPFKQVGVHFDDSSVLEVHRHIEEGSGSEAKASIELRYNAGADGEQRLKLSPKGVDPQKIGFPLEMVDEWLPFLDRVAMAEWRDQRTGELFTIEDVLARFEDALPTRIDPSPIPEWLKRIRESIPVRLIDTERLTGIVPDRTRAPRAHRQGPVTSRAVRRYSLDLAERIQRKFTEYGSLSQSLDRTFPSRLVAESPRPDLGMDQLREDLVAIESKRGRLVKAGLLKSESAGWSVAPPVLETVDESKRGVLAVYARDAKEKLSVFDDLYARVEAFGRIANSRLLYKQVTVGADGLRVTSSDGESLDVEMLSSGEQHELVLLYTLLFRVPNNSFLLIDEPELSLHVAWQEMFLTDLEEMAQLSDFRVLLATHSPQIIGDRWDLTVELHGPNGK